MKAMTPVFRVSYPAVFKPKLNKLSNKEEYSVVALFPKDADLKSLHAACKAAIEKKWGDDKNKWPKNLRLPFRDQAERVKDVEGKEVMPEGYERGAIFMTLKSQHKPGLVDQQTNDIISETDFYAGCYARATINFYAYDQAGNKGVSAGLLNIQKYKDGQPLTMRVKAQDDFEAVDLGDGAVSPASTSAESIFG